MQYKEDSDTRYYIDVDLETRTIIGWAHAQRYGLAQELPKASQQRIFLTRGQYNKLEKR